MSSANLNERAFALVRRMVDDADELNLAVTTLDNGSTVIDAGITVPGSPEAGRLYSEVCLAGCGSVLLREVRIGEDDYPGVEVTVNQPKLGCMASQYAGWAVALDDDGSGAPFFAMGSGPARSLYAAEPLFQDLGYRESAEVGVITLEGRRPPTRAVADKIAAACRIAPQNLSMIIAPTASIVGSIQISARVVETGLHKLHELGFDLDAVLSGSGTCPVAPIAKDDIRAIGRTNDAVLYGGRVRYVADCEDAAIEGVIRQSPSSDSKDYGTLFYDLFKRYGGDFYKIDPMLFSPAQISINNVRSGRVFTAGGLNAEMYKRSCAS